MLEEDRASTTIADVDTPTEGNEIEDCEDDRETTINGKGPVVLPDLETTINGKGPVVLPDLRPGRLRRVVRPPERLM